MNHRELWENSASAWITSVEGGDLTRSLILDGPMLRLSGEVRGLRACDVGCGEGRFSRMLAERGAEVIGVDPTIALLRESKRRDRNGRYIVADAEALPLASDSFDLVISYLVLLDIPDFRAAVREMTRITKPGGRILVANMNSFCSTSDRAWQRDENGNGLYVAVDNYFEERAMVVSWKGIEIVNYHRSFSDYLQPFLEFGLGLTDFEEPKPDQPNPKMDDAMRVPFFHVMQWSKEQPVAGR